MGEQGDQTPRGADLETLYSEHGEGLAGAVRGVLGSTADVQEVIQESFLRAWRARSRGEEPRDPVAWMFVITLNTAKDVRRKLRRRGPAVPLEDVDPMHMKLETRSPSASSENAEAVAAARAAIHRLDERQKEVFLLRVSGGLTFEAIGSALGIPVGTAKTRMRRALRALRGCLAPHAPAFENAREIR